MQRLLLLLAVVFSSLLTLWLFLLILSGLTSLLAPLETQIWLFYSTLTLLFAIGAWLLSRDVARWSVGVRELSVGETWLRDVVRELSERAGLKATPKVGVYESFEVNAWATGPTRNLAMVAVSTRLLETLPRPAIEAVIAHEIAHVANGDMVTMTLLRAWINALVLIPAHFTTCLVTRAVNPRGKAAVYLLTFSILQILISPLGSLWVNAFSLRREFRADQDGAALTSVEQMRNGLMTILHTQTELDDSHQLLSGFKILGHSADNWGALFLSHPTLDQRIERLT